MHWRTVFSSTQPPFGYQSLVVVGKLLLAEEQEGTVYFTIEVQNDDHVSSRPLVATFKGPFWPFLPVVSKTGIEE